MSERDAATIWTPAEAAGRARGRERLIDRKALVVGAGSQPCDDADAPIGNGRAISVLCAREGACVACADRSESAARETLQQIEGEGHGGVVLVGDVTEEAAWARLVAEAKQALGGLDAVVLNVGIGYGRGLDNTPVEAARSTRSASDTSRDRAGCACGHRGTSVHSVYGPSTPRHEFPTSNFKIAGIGQCPEVDDAPADQRRSRWVRCAARGVSQAGRHVADRLC